MNRIFKFYKDPNSEEGQSAHREQVWQGGEVGIFKNTKNK